jgi:hypothetical protein
MNNLQKTIKQLEGIKLDSNLWDSGLIRGISKYIDQPIGLLNNEGLRLLIGQNIGLKFLIPLAIDQLKDNILAEGDLYEGDLLKNVLDSDRQFWIQNKDYYNIIAELYVENSSLFENDNTFRQIRKSFESFIKLEGGIK